MTEPCGKFSDCPGPVEHEGIAYFPTWSEAQAHGEKHAARYFPHWRIVSYLKGYAVQSRKGGFYFNLAGDLPEATLAVEAVDVTKF